MCTVCVWMPLCVFMCACVHACVYVFVCMCVHKQTSHVLSRVHFMWAFTDIILSKCRPFFFIVKANEACLQLETSENTL
jgi:hypothetical protein